MLAAQETCLEELAALKEENVALGEHNENLQAQRDAVVGKLRDLAIERDEIDASRTALAESNALLQKDLEYLQGNVERLHDQIKEHSPISEAYPHLKSKNEELMEENERLWSQIQSLMADSEANKDLSSALQEEMSSVKENLEKLLQEKNGLLEESTSAKAAWSEKLDELTRDHEFELEKNQSTIVSLEQQLEEATITNKSLFDDVSELRATVARLQTLKDEVETLASKRLAENANLLEEITDLRKSIEDGGEDNQKLVAEKLEEMNFLKEEYSALQSLHEAASFSLRATGEENVALKAQLEQSLKEGLLMEALRENITRLENENSEMMDAIHDLQAQAVIKGQKEEDSDMLLETLRNLTDDNNQLKEQIRTLWVDKESLSQDLMNAREALKFFERTKADYQGSLDKVTELQQSMASTTLKLEHALAENGRLLQQVSDLNSSALEPQLMLQDAQREIQALLENLAENQAGCEELEKVLTEAQDRIYSLESQLSKTSTEYAIQMQNAESQIKSLEHEIDILKSHAVVAADHLKHGWEQHVSRPGSALSRSAIYSVAHSEGFVPQKLVVDGSTDPQLLYFVRLSESSLQSMDMYRRELLKKQDALVAAEEEICRLESLASVRNVPRLT